MVSFARYVPKSLHLAFIEAASQGSNSDEALEANLKKVFFLAPDGAFDELKAGDTSDEQLCLP